MSFSIRSLAVLSFLVATSAFAQIKFSDASIQSTAGEPAFERVYWVRGGDTAENNGVKLLATASAIAALLPDPSNRFAIYLEPGDYSMGSTTLSLPAYTSLIGCGREATRLHSLAALTVSAATGTEIMKLSINNGHTGTSIRTILSVPGTLALDDVRLFNFNPFAGIGILGIQIGNGGSVRAHRLEIVLEHTLYGAIQVNADSGVALDLTDFRIFGFGEDLQLGTPYGILITADAPYISLSDGSISAYVSLHIVGGTVEASQADIIGESRAVLVEADGEFYGRDCMLNAGIEPAVRLEDSAAIALLKGCEIQGQLSAPNGGVGRIIDCYTQFFADIPDSDF